MNYFPKYLARRAVLCYFITLAIVSVLFIKWVIPFEFFLFG